MLESVKNLSLHKLITNSSKKQQSLLPIKLFCLSIASSGAAEANCFLDFPLLFPDLELFPFPCFSEI